MPAVLASGHIHCSVGTLHWYDGQMKREEEEVSCVCVLLSAQKDQAGRPNLEVWDTASCQKTAELIQKRQKGWYVVSWPFYLKKPFDLEKKDSQ